MSNRIAPKLLAEFIGTFAFVFIGAGTAAVVGAGIPPARSTHSTPRPKSIPTPEENS